MLQSTDCLWAMQLRVIALRSDEYAICGEQLSDKISTAEGIGIQHCRLTDIFRQGELLLCLQGGIVRIDAVRLGNGDSLRTDRCGFPSLRPQKGNALFLCCCRNGGKCRCPLMTADHCNDDCGWNEQEDIFFHGITSQNDMHPNERIEYGTT